MVFVVCGGLVISQGTTRVTMVIFGTMVSTTWLCFVLPVVLLYVWLEFGFVLDDLIKARSSASQALSRMQATARASTFNDGLFMDGWFMCFRPTEHVIDTAFRLGSGSLFAVMYLPLFALNHAFTVRLFTLGAERVMVSSERARFLNLLLQGLPWLAAAVIGFSHVQFRVGGRNPNWAQLVVGVLALVILYVLSVGL